MTLRIRDCRTKETTAKFETKDSADYVKIVSGFYNEGRIADIDLQEVIVQDFRGNILAIIEFERRERGVYMLIDDVAEFEYREMRIKTAE